MKLDRLGSTLPVRASSSFAQSLGLLRDALGNQFIFTNEANAALDHGIALQVNPLLAVMSDVAGAGDWTGMSHDGTDGTLSTGSGDLILDSLSTILWLADKTSGSPLVNLQGSVRPEFRLREAGGLSVILATDASFDQGLLGVSSLSGHQIVITDLANIGVDHEHADQPDPTLYLHSVTSPFPDETQWGSLAFIAATDYFEITSGSPDINFSVAGLANIARLNATTGLRISNDLEFAVGGSGLAGFSFNTFDGDAFVAQIALPARAGGNRVPVLQIGDKTAPSIVGADLGFFDAVTDPTLAMVSTDNTAYLSFAHNATDGVITTNVGDVLVSPGFRTGAERRVHLRTYNSVAGAPTPDADAVLATDHVILVTTANDPVTLTLEPAATAGAGRMITIKDSGGNAAANNIIIEGDAAETIDGGLNVTIAANYGVVRLVCNGAAWFTI